MITLNINTLLKEELKKTNKANQINTQEHTITDSLETLLEPHQNKCIINTKIGNPNEEKTKLSLMITKKKILLRIKSPLNDSLYKYNISDDQLYLNNNKIDTSFNQTIANLIKKITNNLKNNKGNIQYQ